MDYDLNINDEKFNIDKVDDKIKIDVNFNEINNIDAKNIKNKKFKKRNIDEKKNKINNEVNLNNNNDLNEIEEWMDLKMDKNKNNNDDFDDFNEVNNINNQNINNEKINNDIKEKKIIEEKINVNNKEELINENKNKENEKKEIKDENKENIFDEKKIQEEEEKWNMISKQTKLNKTIKNEENWNVINLKELKNNLKNSKDFKKNIEEKKISFLDCFKFFFKKKRKLNHQEELDILNNLKSNPVKETDNNPYLNTTLNTLLLIINDIKLDKIKIITNKELDDYIIKNNFIKYNINFNELYLFLGFQNQQPFTDFRNSGYLGLFTIFSFIYNNFKIIKNILIKCKNNKYNFSLILIPISIFVLGIINKNVNFTNKFDNIFNCFETLVEVYFFRIYVYLITNDIYFMNIDFYLENLENSGKKNYEIWYNLFIKEKQDYDKILNIKEFQSNLDY